MTTLFLIRHGLTAVTGSRLYGRTPGIDLDERGRRQAAALVERFEGVRLTAAYSSPLERCVQTLEPLAAARRLELRICEPLIEMDVGDWTGRTLGAVRRTNLWKMVQGNPSRFHFPGGESFLDAEARLLDELERIVARHPRGTVAIGTHGDLVRIAVAHFAGAHLDQFQRVLIDPASVSAVHLGGDVPRVLLVNDTGGLGGFAAGPPRRRSAPPTRAPRSGPPRRGDRQGKLRG